MTNNVIAFTRTRNSIARTAAATAPRGRFSNNVVSLADWRDNAHARRTSAGVFFTTGVLCTLGTVA